MIDQPENEIDLVETPTIKQQGQKYFTAYEQFCADSGDTFSPQGMLEWDEKYNYSRLTKLYAPTDDDLIRIGKKALFNRIFYNYTKLVVSMPDGGPVIISDVRPVGPAVGDRARISSPNLTKEQRNYALDSAIADADRAIARVKVLGLPYKELINHVNNIYGI